MRTASRRARRLGGLLLLAATVLWALLRRRTTAVRWTEPPASVPPEPGVPGELPDDVVATDAGLTELPFGEDVPDRSPAAEAASPGDTVDEATIDEATVDEATVDEAKVAELLAESPDAEVVVLDETTYEEAVARAAPEPPAAAAGPPAAEPAAAAEPPAAEPPAAEPAAAVEPVAGVTAELPEPGPAADEPTDPELASRSAQLPDAADAADEDEETDTRIPMPTFSEAPTMELPAVVDDLRAVRGIGPSMERMLHGLGIVSYRQLAMLDGAELERVRAELSEFRSRIEREDWVGQARALHREKYGRDPS